MLLPYTDDDVPAATATGTLLVVDDDEANRDLLARRLGRRGHTVVTAEGGREALALVESQAFDVVLLDVMMPGMSGMDVLRVLRRDYGPTDLPVIMATAKNQSEDVVEALRLGANDYVTKPLDFPVVLARVQSQLSLRHAVEAAARLERQLAERNRELESANRRMERDLHAAAHVQASFLPAPSPVLPGARCHWYYRPCEELAGDGLNAFPLGGGRAGLYVFDVCGHGVASALLSVSICRVLSPPGDPSSVLGTDECDDPRVAIASPAEVADRLNRMFPFDQSDQYFTMVYGVLDPPAGPDESRLFRFVSAGHPGLVHAPVGRPARVLDGRGFPVGLAPTPYQDQTLRVSPGDRVLLYSDGIPEALDPSGEYFGVDRLLQAVDRSRGDRLEGSVDALVGDVLAWCGEGGPRDDVSLLGIEVGRYAAPG